MPSVPIEPRTGSEANPANEPALAEAGDPARAEELPADDLETDYRHLVHTAMWAAGSVFLVKGVASILLAWRFGATVEVRRFFDLVPYIGIRATRPVFASVVTFAGLVMAVGAAVLFIGALVPRRDPGERRHRVIGWFVGVVISLLTLVIEGVRHLLDPPVLRLDWSAQSAAVLIATTLLFAAVLPRDESNRTGRVRRVGFEKQASPRTNQQELPQT